MCVLVGKFGALACISRRIYTYIHRILYAVRSVFSLMRCGEKCIIFAAVARVGMRTRGVREEVGHSGSACLKRTALSFGEELRDSCQREMKRVLLIHRFRLSSLSTDMATVEGGGDMLCIRDEFNPF